MRFDFDVRGLQEVERGFQRLIREVPEALAVGMYLEAESIMSVSKRQVPVDTGRLRATGFVQLPVVSGSEISVTMGYGTNYAIFVHEITTARHRVGKAKYLQDPLEMSAQGMASRVARRAASQLVRGPRVRPGMFPTEPPAEMGAV
jgi:hypothetical protein